LAVRGEAMANFSSRESDLLGKSPGRDTECRQHSGAERGRDGGSNGEEDPGQGHQEDQAAELRGGLLQAGGGQDHGDRCLREVPDRQDQSQREDRYAEEAEHFARVGSWGIFKLQESHIAYNPFPTLDASVLCDSRR